MKTALYIMMLVLLGTSLGLAQQKTAPASDEDGFLNKMATARNPFQSRLPVIIPPAPKPHPKAATVVKVQTAKKITPPAPIKPPTLQISGVIWGEVQQAIINDKIVSVGDTIEGAKLIAVEKSGIVILYHNVKFILKIT